MMEFRTLTENDIEVRVANCTANRVSLLLYKTARTDMDILDETVGPQNWQNRFYECKGNLYCSLGINANFNLPEVPPEWIWKDDCGSQSDIEAEKGEASDARKRAGFAWGIGRELYTSPSIGVAANTCNIKEVEIKGKKIYRCYDKFHVEKIKIEGRKIVALAIRNESTGRRCYLWQQSEQ